MRLLNRDFNLETFFQQLEGKRAKILFLDYDGTLAPFQEDPSKAIPYPGVTDLLNGISRKPDVRLVIISGRAITELQTLLSLDAAVEIWGSHGREHLLRDGTLEQVAVTENQVLGLEVAVNRARNTAPRVRPESKHGTVAFHWRGIAPKKRDEFMDPLRQELTSVAEMHDLQLKAFDGGLELMVPGMDKGLAVRTVLEDATPDSPIAYLGDDQTDEDAFRELKYKGLTILVRPELRETEADLWLEPPAELLAFLEKWI